MKLFDKIRILRKARGLSQEQLGYSLSRVNKDGISRQTVSDWENGKFEPKLENIRDLAEVFDVSFDALLDESIDLDNEQVLYAVINKMPYKEKESKKAETTPEPVIIQKVEKNPITIKQLILLAICSAAVFLFAHSMITEIVQMLSYLDNNGVRQIMLIYLALDLPSLALSSVGLAFSIVSIKRRKRYKIPSIMLIIAFAYALVGDFVTGLPNIFDAIKEINAHEGEGKQFVVGSIINLAYLAITRITFIVVASICLTTSKKQKEVKAQSSEDTFENQSESL